MIVRIAALGSAIAMVLTGVATANELKIGDKAPAFVVQGIDGEKYSLEKIGKEAELVVVCFTCSNCPVARAYEERFIQFNEAYKDKKVAFVAVNSNNATEDLDGMKKHAKENEFNFLYAFDESGQVAKDYGATATPELFIIQGGKLVYHGSFDNKQKEPTESYVASAVDALLAGDTPKVSETKPFGCSIKAK